jgi:hypothetical protein
MDETIFGSNFTRKLWCVENAGIVFFELLGNKTFAVIRCDNFSWDLKTHTNMHIIQFINTSQQFFYAPTHACTQTGTKRNYNYQRFVIDELQSSLALGACSKIITRGGAALASIILSRRRSDYVRGPITCWNRKNTQVSNPR